MAMLGAAFRVKDIASPSGASDLQGVGLRV